MARGRRHQSHRRGPVHPGKLEYRRAPAKSGPSRHGQSHPGCDGNAGTEGALLARLSFSFCDDRARMRLGPLGDCGPRPSFDGGEWVTQRREDLRERRHAYRRRHRLGHHRSRDGRSRRESSRSSCSRAHRASLIASKEKKLGDPGPGHGQHRCSSNCRIPRDQLLGGDEHVPRTGSGGYRRRDRHAQQDPPEGLRRGHRPCAGVPSVLHSRSSKKEGIEVEL